MVLDQQSVSVGSVPPHRFKANFLEYHAEFVNNNKQANNRHIEGSFSHFKAFLKIPGILTMRSGDVDHPLGAEAVPAL
jgi:hypothetical protein